jgi:hypothetical protein
MGTFMHKHTLWAGPEDGLEVTIPPNTYTFFVQGPPKLTPGNVITGLADGPGVELLQGRYQFNSMTRRFEWMGYE